MHLKLATVFLLIVTAHGYAQRKSSATFSEKDDRKQVAAILKKIDNNVADTSIYADDVVHMAQGSRAITNKDSLYRVLQAEASSGHLVMTHEIITLHSYPDMVLTRGRVKGKYHPGDGGAPVPFETNNMITFRRMKNGTLRVWQVIFNRIDSGLMEPQNPFHKFVGEWTLKNNDWYQNWGSGDEHIKIPGHHTINKVLNTDNSLLSVIDGTPPFGHIFWTYNPVKKEVRHLSSFGELRIGVGKGSINEKGDVTLNVSFEGEPDGTYRIYTYTWISNDEYDMNSVQYNANNEPTGNFYRGIFVRIKN